MSTVYTYSHEGAFYASILFVVLALVAISLLMKMPNAYELGRPKKATLPVVVVNDGDMKKEASPSQPNEAEEKSNQASVEEQNNQVSVEEKKPDTPSSQQNEVEKVAACLCLFPLLLVLVNALNQASEAAFGIPHTLQTLVMQNVWAPTTLCEEAYSSF